MAAFQIQKPLLTGNTLESSWDVCNPALIHCLKCWIWRVVTSSALLGGNRAGPFHWPGSGVSWRPSSSAPSCWSPVAGPVPCFSPSGTPGCSHLPDQSSAPCGGLWWEAGPSPPRHLSRRSSWAGLLRQGEMRGRISTNKIKTNSPAKQKIHKDLVLCDLTTKLNYSEMFQRNMIGLGSLDAHNHHQSHWPNCSLLAVWLIFSTFQAQRDFHWFPL